MAVRAVPAGCDTRDDLRAICWFCSLALICSAACVPMDVAAGGAADAKTIGGSDAGTAQDGGAGSGSGSSASGGSSGSSGNGSGSSAGGSSGVTVVNQGGSTTPASHACDGLVPGSIGTQQTWAASYSTADGSGYCGGYGGDGEGIIALERSDNGRPIWDFVSPTGAQSGTASAWRGMLFPGASGFVVYSWGSSYDSGAISFTDESGRFSGNGSAVIGHPVAVADPRGGLLMAGQLGTPFRNQVWSIDARAQVRWGPRPMGSQGAVFGAGVDLRGNALVFLDGGSGNIDAQWFGGDGAPMTGVFRLITGFVPGPSTWFETSAVIGGGLAIRRVDGKDRFTGWTSSWLMLLQAGSASPDGAPDWLAARANTQLEVVRGGRAYVFLPYGRKGPCTQRAEIVAPNGESCGVFDLTMSDRACTTYDLRLGLDGTLLQRLASELERDPNRSSRTCTVRFWPAALR